MASPRARHLEEPVPDVEIGAMTRARRLRFRRVPDTGVTFEAEPEQVSDSHTERENLPDEAEPGVTYRDVEVRWRAGTRLVVDEGDPGEARKRR
jgi:hypothetical protein